MLTKEYIVSFDDEIEINDEQDSIIRNAIYEAMSKAGIEGYGIILT
jgi:hypothetical protein